MNTAVENHQVLPYADDGLETMSPAEEQAAHESERAQAIEREDRIRRAEIGRLHDLDGLQEVLDNILCAYKPRGHRDALIRPELRRQHDEAADFLRSLRELVQEHPQSTACRVLRHEVRQLAEQDVADGVAP